MLTKIGSTISKSIGANFRMTEIQAAIGLEQLKELITLKKEISNK